jgi:hypothetical protein
MIVFFTPVLIIIALAIAITYADKYENAKYGWKNQKQDFERAERCATIGYRWLYLFIFFLVVEVGIFVLATNTNFENVSHYESEVIQHEDKIYSLRVENSINFVLGRGGSSNEYIFYIKDDRGAFWLARRNAYFAAIFETNDTPRIRWREIKYKTHWWWNFWGGKEVKTQTDFYVPYNTIIQEYKV